MTTYGGKIGYGNIFKIEISTDTCTDLFDFNGANGSYPIGSLVSDGTWLYGMTPNVGLNSQGLAFKIKTDGTSYTDLLDFNGTNGGFMSSLIGVVTLMALKIHFLRTVPICME